MIMNNLEDIIKSNGISINKVSLVEPGNYEISNSSKPVLATNYTYSCTNLLIYSDYFAFLAHMLPSETVGNNNNLPERIEKIKRIIEVFGKLVTQVNVLVCKGISDDTNRSKKFHDLSFVNKNLDKLGIYCKERNINYSRLPDEASQYLVFDQQHQKLLTENKEKRLII